MLPKASGFELLPSIRRITDAPIVMLSARGEVEDKVESLAHGADDYLSKPFEVSELLAHVEAKLRRPHIESPEVLQYEGLSVDLRRARGRARRAPARSLAARIRPARDAAAPAAARLSRDELLDEVWGDDADVGTGAVERYISYLRGKVDEGFDRPLIQTVRGAGYTLRA